MPPTSTSSYAPQIPAPHFSRRLKVVFDVSVLGYGQYDEVGRTGVYRVVESVGASMAASHLVDLYFSASECLEMWAHCARFLPTDPRFQQTTLLGPAFGGGVYSMASQVHRRLNVPTVSFPQRVVRGIARRTLRGIEKLVRPLPSRALTDKDIFHSPYWALPPETNEKYLCR